MNKNEQLLESWYEDNQRYLMAALAGVRARLQQNLAGFNQKKDDESNLYFTNADPLNPQQEAVTDQETGQAEIAAAMSAPPSLENICTIFDLSPFERDILMMCAGMELDGSFATLCSAAQSYHQRPYPSFGLAMEMLPRAFWGATTPAAPLRRWRLIEVAAGDTLMSSPLRIDERILHYLTGLSYIDERLKHFIEALYAPEPLTPSQQLLSQRLIEYWTGEVEWPVIQLCGNEPASKLAVIASACSEIGAQAYVMHASDIPASITDRQSLSLLWQREVMFNKNVLVLEYDDSDSKELLARTLSFVENLYGPLVINRREPLHSMKRSIVNMNVNKPDITEQKVLWQTGLSSVANKLNGELDRLVDQFNLGSTAIQAASMEVLADTGIDHSNKDTGKALWRACRNQARPKLDDLAQRIEPMAGWDDLILPDTQKQVLRQAVAHVRQRRQVYERWGFANKSNRGLGISALLAGASGTGKTMAAEVLAGELELDVYRIDLSSVVSKYIGETEKNLRRVFDAAEEGSAILLFDEADALFGKRSEVKDSHDRYANIEVSYLLQRMETYVGLSILTTNLKSALDTAFLRRIRFIIQFPFPDAAQRSEIWRRIYPSATPTADLEIEKLSRLSITGGNIRNIAMNAAFLAAEANEPVSMKHLLAATRSEYVKLEKPLTDSEIAGWVTNTAENFSGVTHS